MGVEVADGVTVGGAGVPTGVFVAVFVGTVGEGVRVMAAMHTFTA